MQSVTWRRTGMKGYVILSAKIVLPYKRVINYQGQGDLPFIGYYSAENCNFHIKVPTITAGKKYEKPLQERVYN